MRMMVAGLAMMPADAQDIEPDGPDIVVTAGKPLRVDAKLLRAAQRRFAEDRPAHAPRATLRFELWRGYSRISATDVGLALTDGAGGQLPVTIDGDGRVVFATLPAGRWFLTAPAQSQGMHLRPIVLSSGTSVEDRRLGDLRAQCRVMVAMAKADASLLAMPLIGMFDAIGGCASKRFGFYHPVEHPLASATATGAGVMRTLRLSVTSTSYEAPLSDRNLPNDARVRLAYR
ncbi:hypothetical protein ASE90_12720 [Sphingomonas sp. Leaf67]|uniref:hypothetical protein n=1 Tax=Sphingomonas sp. Leaf67 TaxID=1736230 RepID=UPI0006FFF78A|nr:hypothetical protein [Sphingomonas sp. Leaf67]KQN81442.1 hypothetical protein ASE90_12720 [Sphingomonas sp. Leaf67]